MRVPCESSSSAQLPARAPSTCAHILCTQGQNAVLGAKVGSHVFWGPTDQSYTYGVWVGVAAAVCAAAAACACAAICAPPRRPPPPPARTTVDVRRATGSSSAEYLRQLSMSQCSNGVFINDPKGLFILRWYREEKGDGTPPDGLRYQSEQSVQVLQADERQRLGGLPLDQQLPDHQQGVPEEALPPASLLFSLHHEKDGGTGGRVETEYV